MPFVFNLTPAQIRAALRPLARRIGAQWGLLAFGAAGPNLGYLAIRGPLGGTLQILLTVDQLVLTPLAAYVADVQGKLRTALRPFEGEFGRGFDKAGRSSLAVGSRGYSANDGWV